MWGRWVCVLFTYVWGMETFLNDYFFGFASYGFCRLFRALSIAHMGYWAYFPHSVMWFGYNDFITDVFWSLAFAVPAAVFSIILSWIAHGFWKAKQKG